MPRTAAAAQAPKTGYAATISADGLQYTMTAGDASNGNTVPWVGNRMMLLLQNVSTDTDYYVTVTSVADRFGRTTAILTQYDVNFGGDPEGIILDREGWQQSDGALYIDVENAAVEFAVLAL